MNNLNLEKIYQRRFGSEIVSRNRMWRILCNEFFQKYVTQDAVVLEIAAGYCEFINNIVAAKKIILDLNPDVIRFAAADVKVIISDSTNMSVVPENSCDVVFASNFFEHLTKEDIVKTIKEIRRVLKAGGRLLVLGPNIRFCYRDYWNFFDHLTPLDDRSLSEVIQINDFKIIESRPKFLPYTTKSKFPKTAFLIRLYLKVPILHYIFGKQLFIFAQKI